MIHPAALGIYHELYDGPQNLVEMMAYSLSRMKEREFYITISRILA